MIPRQNSNLRSQFEAYLPAPYSTLQNSNSLAQFIFRPKGKKVYQLNRTSNPANLSFSHMSNASQNSFSRKGLRNSKSCSKGFINKIDLSSSTRFYGKKGKVLNRDSFSTIKKAKVKKETLYRISDEFRKLKKSTCNASLSHPFHNNQTPTRKELNSTVPDKLKGNKITSESLNRNYITTHSKGDNERSSEVDSPLTFTETATGTKSVDYSRALTFSLINNLKMLEKTKDKYDTEQLFVKSFKIINETFNGVINLDRIFKDVLKQIQQRLQELFNEQQEYYKKTKEGLKIKADKVQAELKKQNEDLKVENEKIVKELDKKSNHTQAQNELIEKLRKQIDLTNMKIQDLSLDLNDLYKDNRRLSQLSTQLYGKLIRARENVQCLFEELKSKMEEEKTEHKVIEVGKNRIKVPSLNLSVLRYYRQYELDDDIEDYNPANILDKGSSEGGIKFI